MRAILVALALPLAACSGAPSEPGVTATRVLEITGLQPVVNAVALSPNGSLVVVGDFDDDLIAREVPSGPSAGRFACDRAGNGVASTECSSRQTHLWS